MTNRNSNKTHKLSWEDAKKARQLLQQLCGDLVIATKTIENLSSFYETPAERDAASDMCFLHLVITLSKLNEFYPHYIPQDCTSDWKKFHLKIEKMKLYDFRCSFVAHIKNKKTKKLFSFQKDLHKHLDNICQGKPENFFLWISNPKNMENTVVTLVKSTIDKLSFDLTFGAVIESAR